MDIVIINVDAPTDEKDEEEKELFYAMFEDVYESVKGNIIIVLGDFNTSLKKTIIYYLDKISCYIWIREMGNSENRRE